MKLFLISAAAAAFVLASPAIAQDDHGHGDHNRGASHAAPAKPEKESKPAERPARADVKTRADRVDVKARTDRTDAKVRADRTTTAKPDTTWRDSNGRVKTTSSPGAVYNNAVRNDARNDNRRDNARDNNRKNNDRNNNWNGNNNRRTDNNNNNRSWQGKFNRRNVTAQHHYRYRGGAYRGPSNYSYRRWAYGETFPSIYFAQNYWINDYSDYGLAYPPEGTVWVRYGNDAVLVDEETGEILEVVYGQFY